jgi:cation transport ATPase
MNTAVKKKLCWNCEGNVSRDALNCPYCGVYLHREEDREEDFESDEESVPPHSPPYDFASHQKQDTTIPTPPYPSQQEPGVRIDPKNGSKKEASWMKTSTDWPRVMIPLVLLMAGSVFLLFALFIALFSQNGFLTLSWSVNTWIVFAVAAFPMLYLGWRSLRQLKE